MRLLPRSKSLKSTESVSQEAQVLWKHLRSGDVAGPRRCEAASSPASSAKGGPQSAKDRVRDSTRALCDLADDCCEALEPNPEAELAIHASFSAVHGSLMEAISASRSGAAAPPQGRRPWHWTPALILQRQNAPRYALAVVLFLAAGVGGHQIGRRAVPVVPVATFVADFDASQSAPEPLELVGSNTKATASWLKDSTGIRVHLPSEKDTGMRLLGARHSTLNGTLVALAHYEMKGVRVVLYQLYAPRFALEGLNENVIGGRSYFTQDYGHNHVVAWRSGDNVLAVVSPLPVTQTIRVAVRMRTHPAPDTFAADDNLRSSDLPETSVNYVQPTVQRSSATPTGPAVRLP